jgi:hypothetical protein
MSGSSLAAYLRDEAPDHPMIAPTSGLFESVTNHGAHSERGRSLVRLTPPWLRKCVHQVDAYFEAASVTRADQEVRARLRLTTFSRDDNDLVLNRHHTWCRPSGADHT